MSWPLKYDPASQSISFGGRDKTLYPNSLAPFEQAVLAAGDICRTYCDHDSSRRPKALYPNSLAPFNQAVVAAGDIYRTYYDHNSSRRPKALYPNSLAQFDQAVLAAGDVCRTYCDRDSSSRPSPENEVFEVGYEKVENKKARGPGPGEDRRAFDTSLHNTTSIPYTTINQLEESRQKRFVESLARGKWNRYRRQYTSNTSYEAHKLTNSLSTNDCASTSSHFPTNLAYLTPSDARCAALNNQAPRDLSLKDRNTEGGGWSSVYLPANPAAIIHTMEGDLLVTVNIDHGMSEAKPSTPTDRSCSPHSSVQEKRAPVRAYPCPRQAQIAFKRPNKKTSREPNVSHKQSFFQKLLHPKENIIKPVIQLAMEVFSLKHNKIQQGEKTTIGCGYCGESPVKERHEGVEGYEMGAECS